MSQLTSLIQAVSNLTNRFNQFMTNAKKVNELPPQVVLNPESLIHVMIDGLSQYITVQQILESSEGGGDLISFKYKSRLNYIDSNTFELPDNVKILDARFNGSGSDIDWSQTGNKLSYEGGTMELGDYLIVIGLYSNVAIGTIPNLNQVTAEGSSTSVPIQSPNAVNSSDLVPLGQVEQMISEIPEGSLNADDIIESPTREFVSPSQKSTWNNKQDKSPNDNKYYALKDGGIAEIIPSVDTNIANTDFTFTENRNQNLNAKKLKFTNGDFEVPALTLTQTAENSKPNKIGTADGLIVKWTNKLGVQRVFAFMSDVLDKTTLVAQTVLSKVTFNGTLVHDPAAVSGIKSALVLNADNEIKQALAVELMADDGSSMKYNSTSELDAIFPTAVSGFELICENISTVNFPNGCIYKKTQGGWKVEKLYLMSDV